MARIRRISLKSKKYVPVSGTSPGSIQLYEGALKPKITIYSFKGDEFHSLEVKTHKEIEKEFNPILDLITGSIFAELVMPNSWNFCKTNSASISWSWRILRIADKGQSLTSIVTFCLP
jgi:hypothetical protein